jgi:Mn2+/Fe2+ NRAMP family transporter
MTHPNSNAPPEPESSLQPETTIQEPPTKISGILRKLGPGLIIAAAIVGSGELIATTLAGAKAGMSLLWLILGGCLIKVFTQIEIGRHTIIHQTPTLSALATVPGPRIRGRGNWLVWYWFAMWFCSIAQLGGILGGVGETLSIAMPITEQGAEFQAIKKDYGSLQLAGVTSPKLTDALAIDYEQRVSRYQVSYPESDPSELRHPYDGRYWAIPIAVGTAVLLYFGRFGLIQALATVLVVVFTTITIGNVFRLQMLPEWAVSLDDIYRGLIPHFPSGESGRSAMAVAIATVGIIGVGAAELVQYPYWCLEKGYARWTGSNDGSPSWTARARGWIRVMRWDAWFSMVVYTIATVAFYFLGAGILHRIGIEPSNSDLLPMLAVIYRPVFSNWAPAVFLVGALIVLYSTFLVANASHARTFADGMSVVGVAKDSSETRVQNSRILSAAFPLLCLLIYWVMPKAATLVIISGVAQAIMLPMLCGAALYFRYTQCPKELRPGVLWDAGLWLSSLVMLLVGLYGIFENVLKVRSLF